MNKKCRNTSYADGSIGIVCDKDFVGDLTADDIIKKEWHKPKLRKNDIAKETKESGFDPEDTNCWGS